MWGSLNTTVNTTDFWRQLYATLEAGQSCVLMVVTGSVGSSPGRKGFKMFVGSTGTMYGSIGGGSMEHKLVELARSLMYQPAAFPFSKNQVHRADEARDRSGMICSGEQTVAFYLLTPEDQELLHRIASSSATSYELVLSSSGIQLYKADVPSPADVWFRERLNTQPRIAIVGGGHVGLALSRVMHQLGFHVTQIDHRDELNTMAANQWAHEKRVVEFENIETCIPDDPEIFIALVSHGYRTDEIALRRLIRRRWKYLGMLGSKAKVDAMWAKLNADGYTDGELARVHAPIGIPIGSVTPEEIAVSIAAGIIRVKNAGPSSWERR